MAHWLKSSIDGTTAIQISIDSIIIDAEATMLSRSECEVLSSLSTHSYSKAVPTRKAMISISTNRFESSFRFMEVRGPFVRKMMSLSRKTERQAPDTETHT